MRNPAPLRPLLAAALSIVACSSSPTASSPSAVVAVNAREYVAIRTNPTDAIPHYEVTVVSRIQNTGSATLYLYTCGASQGPVFTVELVRPSDPAGAAYNGLWACPAGEPLELAAGAERIDTLRLSAPSAVQNGRVLGALSGTMRVVFPATACRATAECAGGQEVQLRSDEFTILLPP